MITGIASAPSRDAARVRRLETWNWAIVVAIALLVVASGTIFERALREMRAAAITTGTIEHERMLSQRIASLAAQSALGDRDARTELSVAIDAFAVSEHALTGGLPQTAVTAFLGQARIVRARSPHDPAFGTALGAVLEAARRPLLDRLDTALYARQAQTSGELTRAEQLGAVAALLLLGTLVAQTLGVVGPSARRAIRLAGAAAEITGLIRTDPLTGTLNRQGFEDRGAVEIAKARRYNRPLSMLMIGPDALGSITAAHGPGAGDTMLKAMTETLFDGTRITDLVGRVGGNEFAVLLPETDPAGAELLAERLRQRIGELAVPLKNVMVSSTVSIGVAAAEKNANFLGPVFARADAALYEAQMRGHDRVFVNAA